MHFCRGKTHYGNPNLPLKPEWQPLEGIEAEQGTGDIFFKPVVPYNIRYHRPVDDPLYSAHRKLREFNRTMYAPDYPIKVVGCLQQVSYTSSIILTYTTDLRVSSSSAMLVMGKTIYALHYNPRLTLCRLQMIFQRLAACSVPF